MLSQHPRDKWSSSGRGWQLLPSQPGCPHLPSLLFLSLSSPCSRVKTPPGKGSAHSWRVQVVLYSPPPEKFTGAGIYTEELRPHQLSRDQQTSPGAPRTEPQRFPEMGTLWWHTKITWSIWDPQRFSKLAHLFYSKLRLNLILLQELPPQQTDSAKNCQHSARLSQWSVCVSSATGFSVP